MSRNIVAFINDGEIDPRAITTLGVSVKEEGSIGYFGTGLKYAIPILLRMGQKITIHSGMDAHEFSIQSEVIRGKSFDMVYMDDVPMGITTELGKNWELWQAYRELICNCMDEGGHYQEEDPGPAPGKTVIVVTGRDFALQHRKRQDIVLESKPFEVLSGLEVHRGKTHNIFYRGVKVYEAHEPFAFTYNILDYVQLTEDRTIASEWSALNCTMLRNLVSTENQEVIRACIYSQDNNMESKMDFTSAGPQHNIGICKASSAFINEAVAAVKMQNPDMNTSIHCFAESKASELLKTHKQVELSPVNQIMLNRAILFCEEIGFPVRDYEIRVLDQLDHRLLGMASNEGIIYITPTAFEMGAKQLTGTLVEEYIHIKYKVEDYTRRFQDILLNRLISLGEKLNGEPI